LTDQQEDHGIEAISKLIELLEPLTPDTRINVLQFVFKALNISMPGMVPTPVFTPQAETPHATAPQPQHQGPTTSLGMPNDIRSLTDIKKPKSANQMVAVVAYYLANLAPPGERRDYITADDIKPYFNQASFPLPNARPSMTLVNTKNAGYLDALNNGRYRLNPVGHNLVALKLGNDDGAPARGLRRGRNSKKTARKPAKKGRK
jgi:hypothetical protein